MLKTRSRDKNAVFDIHPFRVWYSVLIGVLSVGVASLWGHASLTGAEPDGVSRPNIVLIMADDKYNAAEREPSKCRDVGSNCSVFGDSHIASNPVKFSGIGVN